MVNVGVGYGEDLDRVMDVMRAVGAEMRADPANAGKIRDDLEVAGVDELADSAVIIRARFRVLAGTQAPVRRAFLLQVKKAFDAEGIEIPFPQMVMQRVPDPIDSPAREPAVPPAAAPAKPGNAAPMPALAAAETRN